MQRRALLRWLWAAASGASPRPLDLLDAAAWADFATLAEAQGLAAFVLGAALARGRELQEVRPDLAADIAQALAHLQDAADRTLRRGERMAQDLAALRTAFAEAGLEALWLKGAHLALAGVHPAPAARPMADFDVYVPRSAWPAAATCLSGLGYLPGVRSWKHQVWLPASSSVVDLRGEHPDNPRPLELHDRLGEGFRGLRFSLDPEAASVRGAGGGRRLRPAAAMAHLAAHASVNLLERRLRAVQLLDLLRLAAELDDGGWQAVVALAERPRQARFVWPSLALLERLTPGSLPPAALAALERRCRESLRAWLADQSLDALSWPGGQLAARALLEMPRIWPIGLREQLRYWQVVLLPEPALLADRYPRLAERGRLDLMLLRHLAYNWRLLGRRLSQRRP